MRPDSLLIRGLGHDDGEGLSPIVDRSTSFERWSSKTSPYARAGSPTAEEVEALLGELEQAQVLAFASGMTAWSNVCVALLRHGSVLVIPDSGYYEVELLAAGPLAQFGVETRRYSPGDPDGFAKACFGAQLDATQHEHCRPRRHTPGDDAEPGREVVARGSNPQTRAHHYL